MALTLIWHGTASLELISSSGRLLFDPFIPLKGAPYTINAGDFLHPEHILITHGHFDHLSSVPLLCKSKDQLKVYCTVTPFNTLKHKGVEERKLCLIAPGKTLNIQNFEITVLPAKHARLPSLSLRIVKELICSPYVGNLPHIICEHVQYREAGETVAFEIYCEGRRIMILGSLNLIDSYVYPTGCDVLILPYNGWEDNLTPALNIIRRLKPHQVLLDHFDETFLPVSRRIHTSPLIRQDPDLISELSFHRLVHL